MLFKDPEQRPDIGSLITNIFKGYKTNRRPSRISKLLINLLGERLSPYQDKASRFLKSPGRAEQGFDKTKYEGQILDGQRHGKGKIEIRKIGVYQYMNGRYDGYWENNQKSGKGKFSYGLLGTFYYDNGNKYEGDWKNDTMNGYGKYYFSNGDKYEGEWKDGKINGKGISFIYLLRYNSLCRWREV